MESRIFVLLCVFLGGLGQGIVNPKLPELLASPRNLALDAGMSASLMYAAIFLASFWYGRLADRGATYLLLRLGLAAYAAVLVLFSVAASREAVFLLRFLEGLSLSAIYVAADVVLCRCSKDEERGQWLSYYGIALSLGLLFGPALLLIFGALRPGTSLAFSLRSVAAAAVALFALAFRRELPPGPETGAPPRLNRFASASAALYGFLEAGLVAVLAVVVVERFHAKTEEIFIVIILSAAVASALWGHLIDRRGGKRALLLVHAALAAGLAATAALDLASPREAWIYLGSILFGVVAGGLYPAAFSWLVEGVSPSHYGYASGHFTRAYGLGSLLGPLAFGLAVEGYRELGLFGLAALVGATGLLVTARGPGPALTASPPSS